MNDHAMFRVKGLLECLTDNIELVYFVFLFSYNRIWTKEKKKKTPKLYNKLPILPLEMLK